MMDPLRSLWFVTFPYGLYAGTFALGYVGLAVAGRLMRKPYTTELGWSLVRRTLPLRVMGWSARARAGWVSMRRRQYNPEDLPVWMVSLCEEQLEDARKASSSIARQRAALRALVILYAPASPWPKVRLRVAHSMAARAAWFAARLSLIERDPTAFTTLLRPLGTAAEIASGLGQLGERASDVVDLSRLDVVQRARARTGLLEAAQSTAQAWPPRSEFLEPWCEDRLDEHDWHAVEAVAMAALIESDLDEIGTLASLLARAYQGLASRANTLAGSEHDDVLSSYYRNSAVRYESLAQSTSTVRRRCSHPATVARDS